MTQFMLSPYHWTCQFLLENVSHILAVTEQRIQHIVDAVEYTCAQHIQYQPTTIVSVRMVSNIIADKIHSEYLYYLIGQT